MKYLKLSLFSVLQHLFIIILLYIYNEYFSVKGVRLPINLSFYYYIIVILPIVIIVWNIVSVCMKSMKIKFLLQIVLSLAIVLYWINSISTYPYRISFTILVSIMTLFIGNAIINKFLLKDDE